MKSHFDFALRFIRRLSRYSLAGVSTFALDLLIVYVLITFFSIDTPIALAFGFLIGVTINYTLNYYWAYKGTKRNREVGSLIFLSFALVSAFLIVVSVSFFVSLGVELYTARIAVALCIGLMNFILNTFCNFKLL